MSDSTNTNKKQVQEGTYNRTSRGLLQEQIESIGNILAAIEHLHDTIYHTGDISLFAQLKELYSLRRSMIEEAFPSELIDVNYHCIVKHLITTYIQRKEILQALIRDNDANSASSIIADEILSSVRNSLNFFLAKYTKTEVKEDKECMKCVEDRIQAFKEEQLQKEK